MTTARMEAFSDGVFAIAITLLILSISVPDAAPGQLAAKLGQQWPSYLAYVASFLLIGLYWVNHHAVVSKFVGTDRRLLFINLLFLMSISVLPFPTALLARYLQAGHDQRLAAVVYGACALTTAIAFSGIWAYGSAQQRLLHPDVSAHPRRLTPAALLGPAVYLAAIGLAVLSPVAALVLYALLPLYYVSARSGLGM